MIKKSKIHSTVVGMTISVALSVLGLTTIATA